jgi:hypothetical protein
MHLQKVFLVPDTGGSVGKRGLVSKGALREK